MTQQDALVASWPEIDPSCTVLYGIGAQKAATTWLAEQLDAHPAIHVPWRKELHYWSMVRAPYETYMRERARMHAVQAMKGPGTGVFPWGRSAGARAEREERLALDAMLSAASVDHVAYFRFLARQADGARLVADITPMYALLSRLTFAEMLAAHPESKFLLILRDPVDRLASGLRQQFRSALRHDPSNGDQLLVRGFEEALTNPHDPNRRRSDYAAIMTELEAAVPPERRLYLFYETLSAATTRDRLAAFLGLDDLELDASRVVHSSVRDGWALTAEQRARARDVFRETYARVGHMAGDMLPERWSDSATDQAAREAV